MNRGEMKQFVQALIEQLWKPFNVDQVEKFYHQEVEGYFGRQAIHLDDIKNRVLFCKKHFKDFDSKIEDMIIDENKCVIRVHQTWKRIEDNQPQESFIIGIYRFRDDLIDGVWFLSDQPFDYKATNEHWCPGEDSNL